MEQPQIKSPTPSLVHQLYTKILEHRYGATAQNNTLDCFRLVVGSTIVTHERIAIETLGALLGLTPRSTRSSLNCLQSFIYIASWDNTLRIKYPSFEDFLTNKEACPPRFLINSAEQHTILARCCISIMNQLFQSYKVPEGDHVTYAICHFAEHLLGSAAESRMEFLENVRTFAHSQVTKWLVCLFQEVSHEHAIPSIKKVYQWVVSSLVSMLIVHCSLIAPTRLIHSQVKRSSFPFSKVWYGAYRNTTMIKECRLRDVRWLRKHQSGGQLRKKLIFRFATKKMTSSGKLFAH